MTRPWLAPVLVLAACSGGDAPEKNQVPVVTLTAPSDGAEQPVTAPLTVRATIDDDEPMSALEVVLESSLDGILDPPDPAADGTLAMALTDLSVGAHTLTLTVTDSQGATASDAASVVLVGSLAAPTVVIAPSPPRTADDLVASLADDGAYRGMDVAWSWHSDDASGTSSTDTLAAANTARDQTWTAQVTVTDDDGSQARAIASVVIANTPPALASASLSPANPGRTDTLDCTWAGWSDADGDAEGVVVRWFRETTGAPVALSGDQPTRSASDLFPGDTVYCEAVPADDADQGTPVRSNPVTVTNAAPTLGSVSLEAFPSPATAASRLVCSAQGVADADSDLVTVATRWFVDGTELAGVTTSDLTGLTRGTTVTCEMTPSDPWDAGSAVLSAGVDVENQPPTVDSVDLVSGGTCGDWTCLATHSDPDGDSVTPGWRWWVDGTEVTTATTDTLSASDVSVGSQVQCGATPDDGWVGAGSATGPEVRSATRVADDDPPVIDEVRVPDHGRPGDTIRCTVAATDDCTSTLDVSYAWTRNGQLMGAQTADTLSLLGMSAGDQLVCIASVGDGTHTPVTHPSDPLQLAATGWEIQGTIADGLAGYAVAVADDLDGDAYREIVVGAPNTSTTDSARSGKVYVANGRDDVERLTLDSVDDGSTGFVLREGMGSYDLTTMACGPFWSVGGCPTVTDVGELEGRQMGPDGAGLGFALAYPGDIDNDGIGDLLASAPYQLVSEIYQGRAYVLSGNNLDVTALSAATTGAGGYVFDGECGRRKDLDDTVGLTWAHTGTNGDLAGYALSEIGDFNGDGLADFAVSAPNQGWSDEGAVYLVFGRDDGAPVIGTELFERGCDSDLDARAGGADGLNGIAAYGADADENNRFHHYGQVIGPAGDFDGDGYDDLLVQATPVGFTNSAVIVRGGPDRKSLQLEGLDPASKIRIWLGDFSITPPDIWTGRYGMGAPVGGGGDVNGDGRDDIAFQITDYDNVAFLHVLLGRSGDDGDLDLDEEQPGGTDLGWIVGGDLTISNSGEGETRIVGDVNGDGYDDIVAGMPLGDAAERGVVAVIFGAPTAPTGLTLADLRAGNGGYVIDGAADGEHLGWSIGSGDIDGDGLDDILAGAPDADGPTGEARAGRIVVEYGRDFTASIDQYGGPSDEDFAGTSAADTIVAGRGHDYLDGGGGSDVLYGGAGDDTIVIDDDTFLRVRGGAGEDTLVLGSGVSTLDLHAVGRRLEGIERIGLEGQTLTLSAIEISRLSPTSNRLVVEGMNGRIEAVPGDPWVDTGIVSVPEGDFYTLQAGYIELWVSIDLDTAFPPTLFDDPLSIDENLPNGSLVAAAIGTDPDGSDGSLSFTLVDDPAGAFFLHPTTGDLTVIDESVLDFESVPGPWTLTIEITDEDGLLTQGTVEVGLLDLNEPPVVLTPLSLWQVEEGVPARVGRLAAVDLDAGDAVTWSITSDPAGIFDIDPVTGDVTLLPAAFFDYETVDTYAVIATATDNAGLAVDALIDIDVLDSDVIEQNVRVTFDIRDRSVWNNGPARDWPGVGPGAETALIPFEYCWNPENGEAKVVSNWSDVIPLGWLTGDGDTLPIELPFQVDLDSSGRLCMGMNFTFDGGRWSATVPVDIQLNVPDNVVPDTDVVVTSSYIVDWDDASLWGNTPGFRMLFVADMLDFASHIFACETFSGTCGSDSMGPMTAYFQDEVALPVAQWAGTPTASGVSTPAPVETETKDFLWDWSNTYALAVAAAGFPSHIGTLDIDVPGSTPQSSSKFFVDYVFMQTQQIIHEHNRWNYQIDDGGMRAILVLEDGSQVPIDIGVNSTLRVPAGADVDNNGVVDVAIDFELDLDFQNDWYSFFETGFYTWGGDADVRLENLDGEVLSHRHIGPASPQSCGAFFSAGVLTLSADPQSKCVSIEQDLDYDFTSTADASNAVLGAIQIQ